MCQANSQRPAVLPAWNERDLTNWLVIKILFPSNYGCCQTFLKFSVSLFGKIQMNSTYCLVKNWLLKRCWCVRFLKPISNWTNRFDKTANKLTQIEAAIGWYTSRCRDLDRCGSGPCSQLVARRDLRRECFIKAVPPGAFISRTFVCHAPLWRSCSRTWTHTSASLVVSHETFEIWASSYGGGGVFWCGRRLNPIFPSSSLLQSKPQLFKC